MFHGRLAPDANAALRMLGAKVVAFAGIGRPQKFFDRLRPAARGWSPAMAFPTITPIAWEIAALQRQAGGARRAAGDHRKGHGEDRALPDLYGATCRSRSPLPVALVVEEAAELKQMMKEALVNSARRRGVAPAFELWGI